MCDFKIHSFETLSLPLPFQKRIKFFDPWFLLRTHSIPIPQIKRKYFFRFLYNDIHLVFANLNLNSLLMVCDLLISWKIMMLVTLLRTAWIAGTLPILLACIPSPKLDAFHNLLLGFAKRGKTMHSSSRVSTIRESHRFSLSLFFFFNNYYFFIEILGNWRSYHVLFEALREPVFFFWIFYCTVYSKRNSSLVIRYIFLWNFVFSTVNCSIRVTVGEFE